MEARTRHVFACWNFGVEEFVIWLLGFLGTVGVLLCFTPPALPPHETSEVPSFLRATVGMHEETRERPDIPNTSQSVHTFSRRLATQDTLAQSGPVPNQGGAETDGQNQLESKTNLARQLRHEDKFADAERLYREILERREKELGADHVDTLATVNDLAEVLLEQDKLAEAETFFRRALEGHEKVHTPDHPATLNLVDKFAKVLHLQHKYTDAELVYLRAIKAFEDTLGPTDPTTLKAVNNLAEALLDQGKLPEAETFFRQVLEGHEKAHSPDHPRR